MSIRFHATWFCITYHQVDVVVYVDIVISYNQLSFVYIHCYVWVFVFYKKDSWHNNKIMFLVYNLNVEATLLIMFGVESMFGSDWKGWSGLQKCPKKMIWFSF